MLRLILKRLIQLPILLWIVVTVAFFLVHSTPGSPFSDEKALPEAVKQKALEHYGLDQPLPTQYVNYIKNIFSGDLGPSMKYEAYSVNDIIRESAPVSLELGFYAILIALALGIPIGIVAALKHNQFLDYASMSVAMLGICLPAFVLGPAFLVVFSIQLGWFNPIGWEDPSDRVLPSLTIGLYTAAAIARLTRTGMLDILSQDFIRTARAKGASTLRIVLKHALRGGLLPVLSYLGPAIASILSGSFVVETIFNIPGIGRHFINAAFNRDYFLVLGSVFFFSAILMIMNTLVDLMQLWLDPRARSNEAK